MATSLDIDLKVLEGTDAAIKAIASVDLIDRALYFANDTGKMYRAEGGVLKPYGGSATDIILDGGRADEVYQADDIIDGGNASGN
ncbi:MAG: hypothetical protein AB7E36_14870 [Salinivirgaceae bacterium]